LDAAAFGAINSNTKEFILLTTKSAKKQLNTMKKAAVVRMDHITTNEKIAGAAVLGVAVGVAATAIGSSMLHATKPDKDVKSASNETAE
jgi:hypothetical protein